MSGKLVYLGIGTNLGDKYQNVLDAIHLITSSKKIVLQKVSSIYKSTSWGFESSDFFNLVVSIKTTFSPNQLLLFLKEVEITLGRTKKTVEKKFEARIIDLDILFYEGVKSNTTHLILPHPEISKRIFVVKPLLELDCDILLKNNILQETICFNRKESEIILLIQETSKLEIELFNQNHKKY